MASELHIRGILRIIQRYFFLFLKENICCDTSLEPSQRDGSNDGSQNMFSWRISEIWIIIPKLSLLPFLIWSTEMVCVNIKELDHSPPL